MTCDVISTGSRGNAVLLDGKYLFDCGVSLNKIRPHLKNLRVVFLTHVHGDHFNYHTINQIHRRRPLVRFVCGKNMLVPLVTQAGVAPSSIYCPEPGNHHEIGFHDGSSIVFREIPLVHNVENSGWIVEISTPHNGKYTRETALYATDTHHIPVSAPGLDLYMVESNYRGDELEVRKARKQADGLFCYEDTVEASHMSHETITAWLAENAAPHSKVVFLHGHAEKENL